MMHLARSTWLLQGAAADVKENIQEGYDAAKKNVK
jgi:hypothetical protein